VVLTQYSATPFAVRAAHRIGVPGLAILHDVYGLKESVRMKGAAIGVARWIGLEQTMRMIRPDAFLVNSHSTASLAARLSAGRPVTVIPAGADHLSPGEETRGDRSGVLFVGRLVPRKGVADLVRAMRILRDRGVEATATVIGSGPEDARLRALASDLGADVRFAGAVPDADLESAIRGAAVLVLPSTREGWGLAITESAARGTPYVAYDIPAVREQHERLQGGLLVVPGASELAAALEELIRNPDRARELGERGRRHASEMRWADAGELAERALREAIALRARRS
jgi:glycosyltransferase involved in cell wall biosynthesis